MTHVLISNQEVSPTAIPSTVVFVATKRCTYGGTELSLGPASLNGGRAVRRDALPGSRERDLGFEPVTSDGVRFASPRPVTEESQQI